MQKQRVLEDCLEIKVCDGWMWIVTQTLRRLLCLITGFFLGVSGFEMEKKITC